MADTTTDGTRPEDDSHRDQLPLRVRSFSPFPWQIVTVASLALFFGFVFAELFWLIARPLALLFVAIVIASALAPIVDRLSEVIPRIAAIIGIYVIILTIFVGLGWLVFPPMVTQATELFQNRAQIVEDARQWIDQFDVVDSSRIVSTVENRLSDYASALADLPLTIVSTVLDIVLVIFMSIYWLIAMPSMKRFVLSLVPNANRAHADETLAELGSTMGGYVRGAVIDGVIVGALTYVGLLVIGVDYAIVLAVTAGLFELVPVVGPIAATVPTRWYRLS